MNWKQLRDISFFVEIEEEGPGWQEDWGICLSRVKHGKITVVFFSCRISNQNSQ